MDYKYNDLILNFRGNLGLICSLRRSHPQLSPWRGFLRKLLWALKDFQKDLWAFFSVIVHLIKLLIVIVRGGQEGRDDLSLSHVFSVFDSICHVLRQSASLSQQRASNCDLPLSEKVIGRGQVFQIKSLTSFSGGFVVGRGHLWGEPFRFRFCIQWHLMMREPLA